ncbi:MAG: MFS transporter [Butyrivibrio sp.]|uniref:MFS transporter n=1 Tax=Butyrivibrio sp. TaxID=28121 RepID=UPI001B78C4FF|nr:MFS transporter [Butyrivibrio sp.]MBP3783774.1 MFS transporter [Butyrivibrio sp.]
METKKKVPMLNKIAYALGTGGGNVFSQIAAAFLLQYYTDTALLVIGTVVRSLGAGPLLSAVFALVPDVVEYGYWKFGIRSEGLISSAQSVGSKVGIGLGSALTGWILAAVHYDPTVMEQSEAVVNAVKFDFTWLGAIISVVILVVVLMLNVEKYADQYRKERN